MKAVITGASSGIGRELAKILCEERKSTVLGVGRDKTRGFTLYFSSWPLRLGFFSVKCFS